MGSSSGMMTLEHKELERIRRRSKPENYISPTISKDDQDDVNKKVALQSLRSSAAEKEEQPTTPIEHHHHSLQYNKTKELVNQSKERLTEIKRMMSEKVAESPRQQQKNKSRVSSITSSSFLLVLIMVVYI